jgi:hypothetical protein
VAHQGPEQRRTARLPTRCRVWFRDRFGAWEGETEDMSSRGCRIVSQRPLKVGALVMLTVSSDRLGEPLVLAGQVIWAVPGPPARSGIAFAGTGPEGPGPHAWVSTLEAVQLGLDSAAPGVTLVPQQAPDLEVLVAPPEPEDSTPAALAHRLGERAAQLVDEGQPRAAEILLRRALVFAPGDAELEERLARALEAEGKVEP